MEEKLNRLYFTANLREGDLECLIASLKRLRQAEILAEKLGIKTIKELEDYERVVTLLVPTAGLQSLAFELKVRALNRGHSTSMTLPLFPWRKISGSSSRT